MDLSIPSMNNSNLKSEKKKVTKVMKLMALTKYGD